MENKNQINQVKGKLSDQEGKLIKKAEEFFKLSIDENNVKNASNLFGRGLSSFLSLYKTVVGGENIALKVIKLV